MENISNNKMNFFDKLKITYIIFLFFLIFNKIFTLDPEIDISANTTEIFFGEQIVVTITINEKANHIESPNDTKYQILYTGESVNNQVILVNGKIENKKLYIYSFILKPFISGNITIKSFKIYIKEKIYHTEEFKIKVLKPENKIIKKINPEDDDELLTEIQKLYKANRPPEIFFKLVPAKNEVYQNQQLIVEGYIISSLKEVFDYKYYETSPIRYDKAICYDISYTISNKIYYYNGYYIKTEKRYIFYPIEYGTMGIAPPEIVAVSPFGQIKLKTENLGINIKSIDYNLEYIGNLIIKSKISTNISTVGGIINLELEFIGNGNLKYFSDPYGVIIDKSYLMSKPLVSLSLIDIRNNNYIFSQKVIYSIVSLYEGTLKIPELDIKYYDNKLNVKYIKIPEHTIKILKKEKNYKITNYNFNYKNLKKLKVFNFLLFNKFIISLYIFFIFLPIISYFYGSDLYKISNFKNYNRKINADKNLSNILNQAEIALNNKNYKEFYSLTIKGVINYITDKLDLPKGIAFPDLLKKLKELNYPDDIISITNNLYNKCINNAYNYVINNNEIDSIINQSKIIINYFKLK